MSSDDPHDSKWTLSGRIPKRLGSVGVTAASVLIGTGEISSAIPPSDNPPKVAKDDAIQQEVRFLIRTLTTQLQDEVKRKVTTEEIHKLITILGSKVFHERDAASKELIAMGDSAKPELTKALDDPDLEIARRVELSLEAIDNRYHDKAQTLLNTVGRLGELRAAAKDAVPVLIEALAKDNTDLRKTVVTTLGHIGPGAGAAVPALTDALKHKDPVVRVAAARALGYIGPGARAAVPALSDALKDKNEDVRRFVAITLGYIGPGAKAAVPALSDALKDNDPNVRVPVAIALGHIGPGAKGAVPALTEALKDPDKEVRFFAVDTLGKFGPEAKAAVPALTELVNAKPGQESEAVKRWAAQALEAINRGRGR